MEEIYPYGITATTIFRAVTQNGSCTRQTQELQHYLSYHIKPTPQVQVHLSSVKGILAINFIVVFQAVKIS
jgi:hypothetical protein